MSIRTTRPAPKSRFQRWREKKGLDIATVARAGGVTFRAAKYWDLGTYKPKGKQILSLARNLSAAGVPTDSEEILGL